MAYAFDASPPPGMITLPSDPRIAPGFAATVGTLGRWNGVTFEMIGVSATAWRIVPNMAQDGQLVAGREFLGAFHTAVLAGTAKIVCSGDSTTAGHTGYLSSAIKTRGILGITVVDRGQSGKDSAEWVASYLADDIAAVPNLFVVRWGVNDCIHHDRTVAQFIASMRQGLATIRAAQTLAQASIILLSPNATSYGVGNGDAAWYEEANEGLRQAAAEYQCAFIDLYSAFRTPTTTWQDASLIHPQGCGDNWIWGLLADVIFPSGLWANPVPALCTMANSWVTFAAGCDAYASKEGPRCFLRGLIKSGSTTANAKILDLPVAAWGVGGAGNDQRHSVPTSGGTGSVRIAGSSLYVDTLPANGWVDISGVNWRAGGFV